MAVATAEVYCCIMINISKDLILYLIKMWEYIDPMKIQVSYSNQEIEKRMKFLHEEINKLSYQIYKYSKELERCHQCYPRN